MAGMDSKSKQSATAETASSSRTGKNKNQPQTRQEFLTTEPPPDPQFLNERALLTRLPVSRRTLFNWRTSGKIPCVKIGRRCLYHFPSIEAALLRLQRGGVE